MYLREFHTPNLLLDDFCTDLYGHFISTTPTRGIEIAFPPYKLIVED
jgi:hypothetical protein